MAKHYILTVILILWSSLGWSKDIYIDQNLGPYRSLEDVNSLMQEVLDKAVSGDSIIFGYRKKYLVRNLYLKNLKNITIIGNGATLTAINTKGESYYQDAGILGLYACQNILIKNLIFDGQRASQRKEGFNMGLFIGSTMNAKEFYKTNFGLKKVSRNITVSGCTFLSTGMNNRGIDTFGDGIGAHAVDGLSVTGCLFQDMGRWAVAASESLNVHIYKNTVNNPCHGPALGAFDIENEGEDQKNGSYSAWINISDNTISGRGAIFIVSAKTTFNFKGKSHGIDNIVISNNNMSITEAKNYAQDAIYIICRNTITKPDAFISNLKIINNSIKVQEGKVDHGIKIVADGGHNSYSNILIDGNRVAGTTFAIGLQDMQKAALKNVMISNNVFTIHSKASQFLKNNSSTPKILFKNNKVQPHE